MYDCYDSQEGEAKFYLDLLTHRVPAGVDEAAYVKASFLTAIALKKTSSPLLSPEDATALLGTMQGGYNILSLIDLLENESLGGKAADALRYTILLFESFHDVEAKSKAGNPHAQRVMDSWAAADWFTSRPTLPKSLTMTVFKVNGETNTDDLSPAPDACNHPLLLPLLLLLLPFLLLLFSFFFFLILSFFFFVFLLRLSSSSSSSSSSSPSSSSSSFAFSTSLFQYNHFFFT